jgi:hypothetical protein
LDLVDTASIPSRKPCEQPSNVDFVAQYWHKAEDQRYNNFGSYPGVDLPCIRRRQTGEFRSSAEPPLREQPAPRKVDGVNCNWLLSCARGAAQSPWQRIEAVSGNNSMASFSSATSENPRQKIVHIGANPIDGDPPYVSLLRAGNAEIVGFEPNHLALAKLNETKGPRAVYLPHAVGDGGEHTLHICAAPGMTSLLAPDRCAQSLSRFSHLGTCRGNRTGSHCTPG